MFVNMFANVFNVFVICFSKHQFKAVRRTAFSLFTAYQILNYQPCQYFFRSYSFITFPSSSFSMNQVPS